MNSTTQEQVTIQGVTYDVMVSTTPEQAEAAGRVNTAVHMVANRNARHLDLKRPSGRKGFFAVQFENGSYSTVADMGYVW